MSHDEEGTSLPKMILTAITFNELTQTKPAATNTKYVGRANGPTTLFRGLAIGVGGIVVLGLTLCGIFDHAFEKDGVYPLFEEFKKMINSGSPRPPQGISEGQYNIISKRVALSKKLTVECNPTLVLPGSGAANNNERYTTSLSAGTLLQVYNQEITDLKNPVQVSVYTPQGNDTCYFLTDTAKLVKVDQYKGPSTREAEEMRRKDNLRRGYLKEGQLTIGGAH